MTQGELDTVQAEHLLWLSGGIGGVQADLSGADCRFLDFTGMDFTDSVAVATDFRFAILDGSAWENASMVGSKLDNASAVGAMFLAADLSTITANASNFTNADVSMSNLSGAIFRGATIIGWRTGGSTTDSATDFRGAIRS